MKEEEEEEVEQVAWAKLRQVAGRAPSRPQERQINLILCSAIRAAQSVCLISEPAGDHHLFRVVFLWLGRAE